GCPKKALYEGNFVRAMLVAAERGLTMKSKLSVALAAAGCVLAVSPANAISVTINPGTTITSVPGAVLFDDFDSVQNTATGTITGGFVKGSWRQAARDRPLRPGISSMRTALSVRRSMSR